MQKYLCLFIACIMITNLHSQDSGFTGLTDSARVLGRIMDDLKQPVPLATVVVLRQPDSVTYKKFTSDLQGNFSFSILPGKYLVEISFVSFESRYIPISIGNNDTSLGDITLMPAGKSMQAVVVIAERPQLRLEHDKRIYDVASDMMNSGGNASDVLNNVPSINVDIDGNVSLRGSQGVRILIDGKPSALTNTADALKQLPANIIESVEVITNPSARYEASGEAGIINIILKKNKRRGLNGIITANAGYPYEFGGSFNLNYRKNKINWFTTYGVDYRSNPGKGTSFQQFNTADTSFSYSQDRSIERSGVSHNLIAGMDYFFNDKTSITGSFLYNPSDGINTSTLTYLDYDKLGSLSNTVIREEKESEKDTEMEAGLSFRKEFSERDHLLTADIKYVWEDEVELSDYNETNNKTGNIMLQRADNRANEHNLLFQSDYIHPFSEDSKFEVGFRSSFRKIQNTYLLEEKAGGSNEWNILPAFDNNMIYNENIHAAYLMGATKLKKWSLQGGLRLEYSDITTELTKTNNRNHRDYLNLFPSANLAYEFNEKNSLQLSYSYRINRPRYRELLPYSNFSDLRSFFRGNPDLNPEFTHSFEAGHLATWDKGTFLSNVYYRYRKGVIQRFTSVDSNGIANTIPINLATEDAYGLEFNLVLNPTDWWRLSSNFNLYRALTYGQYEGEDLFSDAFSGDNRTTMRFNLSDKWELQASSFYRAPRVTPQGKDQSIWFADLGISGDVLKGNGTLTFNIRDIFNTRMRRNTVIRTGYFSESEFQWRSRQFRISFSYRINRQKEREERGGNRNEEGGMGEEF